MPPSFTTAKDNTRVCDRTRKLSLSSNAGAQFVLSWLVSGLQPRTESYETSNGSIKHTEDTISILHTAAFCG